MTVLGIETSCDECSAAIVIDGITILSNVVYSQIDHHRRFEGVVPEIASRKHIEWIDLVISEALATAGLAINNIDAVAVTNRPGLIGSLLVGLSYAKGLSMTLDIPLIGVNHIQAHIYAPHMEQEIAYPYIALLLSGGHTIIAQINDFDLIEILGTTIDDACGEAFDKIAKYFNMGYPGGVAVQNLSAQGNSEAFKFPKPSLHKGDHLYDVSYSGLKTATIHQREQFRNKLHADTKENIAASFQKTAVDIVVDKALLACKKTGNTRLIAAGGVAANSYLRQRLHSEKPIKAIFPSLGLCTDNAAMIAGLGYKLLSKGQRSSLDLNAEARVPAFRGKYP